MEQQPVMISNSNKKKAHSNMNMEEETVSSNFKKGAWCREEDRKLTAYIGRYGIWNWNHMAKPAGLSRTGKSCRLRWMNYLKPGVRHGTFTKEEEDTIIRWHQILGNKWATIASKLEQRTDNEVKNYWHTRIKKRLHKSMQDGNKFAHSNIISQNLTQVVNNEATDNTTPNSEYELGFLVDNTMPSEFRVEDDRKSVNNGTTDAAPPRTDTEFKSLLDDSLRNEFLSNEVDENLVADVFVESSSGIAAAELDSIWKQLPDLPSMEDILTEADFGETTKVSGRFTSPYPLQENIPNEYLIYDLWESL